MSTCHRCPSQGSHFNPNFGPDQMQFLHLHFCWSNWQWLYLCFLSLFWRNLFVKLLPQCSVLLKCHQQYLTSLHTWEWELQLWKESLSTWPAWLLSDYLQKTDLWDPPWIQSIKCLAIKIPPSFNLMILLQGNIIISSLVIINAYINLVWSPVNDHGWNP